MVTASSNENFVEMTAQNEVIDTPTLHDLSHFLHFLAYTYLVHNRTEHALILFNVLRNVQPEDGQIALSMGYCLWKLGYHEEAIRESEKSWELASHTWYAPYALLLKSKALWQLQRQSEARHFFKEFIRLQNNN